MHRPFTVNVVYILPGNGTPNNWGVSPPERELK
jgi:hypothetical protein